MYKNAVVFPGQGSQSVGMLSDVFAEYAVAQETLAQADEVLGFKISDLILNGPAEELNSTNNTQPALVAVEVALWRAMNGAFAADVMAGHSLGEYSALVCAGALSFEDALLLVRRRGELMQIAVPNGVGAMAAILGMEDNKVEEICVQSAQGQVVQAANYNSPGQLVIAGNKEAVERAVDACKENGAKRAMLLPVSGPFHSALMAPAADEFAQFLEGFDVKNPSVPVLQNATNTFEQDAQQIRLNLVKQIASPVRWTQSVLQLADKGVENLVEVGPGKVLTGLNKRIAKQLNSQTVNSVSTLQAL
ncbi:ACP S-malonyltransferase [Oceaniserpentilla sp. 4NH20-0058]|uniref:ACP S-malonyltransferase n=1 Tax=Oceaniserpentilla sp. 4NH20-0058 TaxID=3127660 RepID=UPI0033414DB4